MSLVKNNLLSKFLETEEVLANTEQPEVSRLKDRKVDSSRLSMSELINYNTSKRYASKNMSEEIIRWKRNYIQKDHVGEMSYREIRLKRLAKWINPNAQLILEFENYKSRLTFESEEIEERVYKLVKNEFFGFLNFGSLDTYISIGEDVFISRYIETDLVITRDRLLIELDFIKENNQKYSDVEYYERYSEIRGKDVLVIGVIIKKENNKKQLKNDSKAIRVRSVRKRPIVNV
jgi:hypothetical protein